MDLVFIFLIGLCIGSFLNVLIDRLPLEQNVLTDRSRCDFCGKPLRWFELIPVFSYLSQQGKCRRCGKHLSWQYPLLEVSTAMIGVLLYRHLLSIDFMPNALLIGIGLICIASSSLVIFMTDLKTQIIPDSMTILFTVGVVFYRIAVGGQLLWFVLTSVGFGVFFYALWYFSHGRAMGFGDVKLAPVLGLWLGVPKGIIALYIAFLTGAFVGVILLIRRRAKLKSHIAFGPFLLVGTIVAAIWGDALWSWWLLLL